MLAKEPRRFSRFRRLCQLGDNFPMSRATQKPRSDATLKTLPEAVQEALFALLRTESYARVRDIAREKWEVQTSPAALSEFFRWYPLSRRLEVAKSTADEMAKILAGLGDVTLDAAAIQRATQAMFEAQALRANDSETYIQLAKLRLSREAGERDARRIALLETRAAQADKAEGVTRDETLTPEERAARLREIFGLRA